MRHHMWTNHSFAIRNVLIALGSRVSMSVADDGIGMRINDCHKSDNLARKTYLYRGGRSVVAGFVHVDTVRCGTTREIHVDAPGRVTAVARVLTRPGAMPQLHTC